MKKILIISNLNEPGVNCVVKELEALEIPFLRINSDNFYESSSLGISLNTGINNKHSTIEYNNETLNTKDVISIWYRRPELPKSSNKKGISNPESFIADEWRSTIWSFITTTNAFWINYPLWGINLLEHNKMYQLELAKKVGLKIPETIVTNSYKNLLDFCDKQNGVIACKVVCSRLFQDENQNTHGIYTQKIFRSDIEGKEANIERSPLMAQQYIEKDFELRITVIGHHIFTCAIYSQDSMKTKDDWRRYDFENVRHQLFELPVNIRSKVLKFMAECKLNFGAIDMIVTPSGEYYFLEVNPSGQFGWIEALTDMPIAKTIAKSLNEPKNNGLIRFTH